MNIGTLTVGTLSVGGAAIDYAPAPLSAQIDATGAVLNVTYTETVEGTGTGHTLNSGTLGSPSGSGETRSFSITPVVYQGQTRTLSITSTDLVDGTSQAMEDVAGFPIENLSEEVPEESEGGGDFPLTTGAGTPTYATGYNGQAFQGDGSRWLKAVDIDDTPDTYDWAIECRFKTSGDGGLCGLFAQIYMSVAGGKLDGVYGNQTPGNRITSSTDVNDNAWHHARLETNTISGELFLDGVSVGTNSTDRTIGGPFGGYVFSVGSIGAGTPTSGLVDEVKIYRDGVLYAYWKLDGNGDAEVGGAPLIYSDNFISGEENQPFQGYQILASGMPTSYGATGLPAGLSVNKGTGAITGTPTEFGEFDVDISATSATGTGNGTVTITVFEELGWIYDDLLSIPGQGVTMINSGGTRQGYWAAPDYPEFVPRSFIGAGFLFTRQHVCLVKHLPAMNGTVSHGGVDYPYTVVNYIDIGDIRIGLLDAPMPVTFEPGKILSSDMLDEFAGRLVPVCYASDAGKECTIFEAWFNTDLDSRDFDLYVATNPYRQEYKRPYLPAGGESGSMVFAYYRKNGVSTFVPLMPNGGRSAFIPTLTQFQSWADTVGNPNSYTVQEFVKP